MSSINYNFLKKIDANIKEYPIFVETGTFQGDTVLAMEKYFERLYTIEIKKKFYSKVKSKYTGNKIKFFLGDSADMLNKVVDMLDDNTVFFLDGHYSSGNTGRGKKDTPLLEELECITSKFKYKAIIIIDDSRLFGRSPRKGSYKLDWENINEKNILKIVQDRVEKHHYLDHKDRKNDIYVIYMSKESSNR